jgi:hypothetical protein
MNASREGGLSMTNVIVDPADEAIKRRLLTEHLPYELDMIEAAFLFLSDAKYAEWRQIAAFKNVAIEGFWTHARNLIEFLTNGPNIRPAGTASARDFAPSLQPEMIMRDMDRRINEGVSHLVYERKSAQEDKLCGHDMLRVKQHIDREIKKLEAALQPDYKALWSQRAPSVWIETYDLLSATDTTSSTSIYVSNFNFAGPRSDSDPAA